MTNQDNTNEPLLTQPENDAPAALSNLTPEQNVLLNVIGEKADDLAAFFHILNHANVVEEGKAAPYDAVRLAEAKAAIDSGFSQLTQAIRGW